MFIVGRRRGLVHARIPNVMMLRNNHSQMIDINVLPSGNDAAQLYRENGGHLTDPEVYGVDPISDDTAKLSIRERAFFGRFHFSDIFQDLINGNVTKFENGLLYFIEITKRLSLS